MRKAKEQERERILQYLKKNVQECLYLYIDITNYGIESENMKVWYLEEKDELSLVAMKYYDSYQIYSHKRNGDLAELIQLLGENPVSMISGRKDLIERLEVGLSGYKALYGVILRSYPYERAEDRKFRIIRATERDALDIAKLLCSDEIFGAQFSEEVLQAQIEERIRTRTGRSYIVREENTNELIAHIATYAETQDIAIVSGSIIAPNYRKTSVFAELDQHICCQLGRENKDIYALSTEKRLIRLHKTLHTDCGEYGKLVKMK